MTHFGKKVFSTYVCVLKVNIEIDYKWNYIYESNYRIQILIYPILNRKNSTAKHTEPF